MRRLMMLLTIVAMLVFATSATAFADAPAPSTNGPGNPQTPTTSPASPTQQNGNNCYGYENSNFLKGPGGNPGSPANPTTNNGQPDYTGHAVSTLDPGQISQFQQDYKNNYAGTSNC